MGVGLVQWVRYVRCSFLLALLALCFIAFSEIHPCYAEEGDSESVTGESDIDEMELLCQKIEQGDQYKDLVVDITSAGFSVEDVVNPGVDPVDGRFSRIIHNLLARYINVMFDWESYCKKKGHFTSGGKWERDYSMWSSFQGYMNIADPLLQPSLAHLLHIAFNDRRYVHKKEREYLKLRLQVIKKIFWPGDSNLMTDWESIYTAVHDSMLAWPSDLSFYFKAENTKTLKAKVKKEFLENFKGDQNATKKALSFILNHIGARAYGVATGSKGNKESPSNVEEDKIMLRTAWDASCDLSRSSTASASRDALRIPHFSFVYQYLRTGDKIEMSRKLLGLAWFQQAFIERDSARLGQNAVLFSRIKEYRFPKPLLKQGGVIGGSSISTDNYVGASSPRSPLFIMTGAGIILGGDEKSPALYIKPSPPVASVESVASKISKVPNSAHITRDKPDSPISVLVNRDREKLSSSRGEAALSPDGSMRNDGLLMLAPVASSKK